MMTAFLINAQPLLFKNIHQQSQSLERTIKPHCKNIDTLHNHFVLLFYLWYITQGYK